MVVPRMQVLLEHFMICVPRRFIIDNHNLSTDTNTLLLEFPNQPLWTNVYIQNQAKATVPLFWSRVQVIILYCAGYWFHYSNFETLSFPISSQGGSKRFVASFYGLILE